MTKRKYNHKRRPSRLDRIEGKCDRILSELIIIRQRLSQRPDDMDVAIERLHRAARKLRVQCEKERDNARRMFISKYPEE